jgi:hypothetical protein
MRSLDFLNGTHNRWRNVTVRRGYKWANLKIGEMVYLTTDGIMNDFPYDIAIIRAITIKPFADIKQDELKREHDPSCRDRAGLFRTMRKIYPDFQKQEVVTIIEYQPLHSRI